MISIINKIIKKVINTLFSSNSAIWFRKDIDAYINKYDKNIDIYVDFKNRNIKTWLKEQHSQFPWLYIPQELECAENNNHVFASILVENNIIGYIKIAFNNVYIHDFDDIVKLPNDVSFIYDTFILPNYRGKNIIPTVFEDINSFIKKKGAKNIYCHIPAWNTASIKLYNKLGFQDVSTIAYVRILKLKFIFKNSRLTATKPKDIFNEF